MSLTSTIKKIIGPHGVENLRFWMQNEKYLEARMRGYAHFIKTDLPYNTYSIPGKHLFFGYYDLQQINARGDYLLAHSVDQKARACVDPAQICVIERGDGKINAIAKTYAWSWQQGSRLRWHPIKEDVLIFNAVKDGTYCTELWNVPLGKLEEEWPFACYDMAPDFSYGLSLNFSRLQRLRPGYGYSVLPDVTLSQPAPKEDGVFRCDPVSGEREQIISLHELAASSKDKQCQFQHYINHISISPSGKRFLFFHIWTKDSMSAWSVELYSALSNGSGLRRLETEDVRISHYCWKNDTVILTTTSDGIYAEYDVESGKKTLLNVPELCHNGHPTYYRNQRLILTDTYPLEKEMQQLFIIERNGDGYRGIARLFSDPRLYGEKRCDLHPRLYKDERIITVDSTCWDKRRCILEFEL